MEHVDILKERLFVARRRRDWTQEELAGRCALFKTDISKYERGTAMPSAARLLRLADALEVTTDYLLGRAEQDRAYHD